MDFSDDELRRLELLAALELGPEEHARMRSDLARILEYVRALQQLDVTDVPPTFHGIDARPPLRLDEVRESLSPEDVLRNLHEVATDSQIALATFIPKAIVAKAQYSEWPISITLDGTYHDLGRFFARIASMSRLMSIAELNVKSQTKPNTKTTVTATCIATTFVFRKDFLQVGAPGAPGVPGAPGTPGMPPGTPAPGGRQ